MPVTYESIATQTLSSPASSITFSGIANSWTDLRLMITGYANTGNQLVMRFNADSGSNYSYTDFITNGSTVTSSATANQTSFVIHYNGFDSTIATFVPIDIMSYASTSNNKTVLFSWNATRDTDGFVKYSVGLWRNTAAITSITLTSDGNMGVGTTATLYGIKNA